MIAFQRDCLFWLCGIGLSEKAKRGIITNRNIHMLHHGKVVLLSCCLLPCGWMYNMFNTPGHHPLQPTSQRLECGLKHTASENISTEHDEQPTS